MRTALFISTLVVILHTQVFSQSLADQGCGTPGDYPEWLAGYLANDHNFHARNADEVIYLPLAVHTLGDDKGEGHYSILKIFESICRLNEDFEPFNIQFFLKGDVNRINRSRYYEHDNFSDGFQMMQSYKKTLAINTFITASAPSDACGYYHPSADGIVVIKNCMGGSAHTWTHEIGHWLSLPHTFSGWEGKDYDPKDETPLFHGVSGRDTIFVESVSGKNCHKAADRFCDTSPDYLSIGWNCRSESSESLIVQKDPFGDDFRSDGSNYMSYSTDNCQSQFSLGQIDAMRAYIDFAKNFYVDQGLPFNDVAPVPVGISFPLDDDKIHYQSVDLEWQHHPNATHYLVQISRFSFFAVIDYEFVVEGNKIDIGDLPVDKKYYWRIMPYNPYDFCGEFTDAGGFSTYDITAIEEIDASNGVEIYPTLLQKNISDLFIQFDFQEILTTRVTLYDVTGSLVMQRTLENPGRQLVELAAHQLPAGMYLLTIATARGNLVKKISVQ